MDHYSLGVLSQYSKALLLTIKEVFKMKILEKAKNGQPVYLIKIYEELTASELDELRFPYTDSKEDYKNYAVHYSKKGELIRVQPHDFSGKKKKEIEKMINQPDILDSMQVLFGRKHSRAYQSSKKRLNVSNNEINNARRIVRGK